MTQSHTRQFFRNSSGGGQAQVKLLIGGAVLIVAHGDAHAMGPPCPDRNLPLDAARGLLDRHAGRGRLQRIAERVSFRVRGLHIIDVAAPFRRRSCSPPFSCGCHSAASALSSLALRDPCRRLHERVSRIQNPCRRGVKRRTDRPETLGRSDQAVVIGDYAMGEPGRSRRSGLLFKTGHRVRD